MPLCTLPSSSSPSIFSRMVRKDYSKNKVHFAVKKLFNVKSLQKWTSNTNLLHCKSCSMQSCRKKPYASFLLFFKEKAFLIDSLKSDIRAAAFQRLFFRIQSDNCSYSHLGITISKLITKFCERKLKNFWKQRQPFEVVNVAVLPCYFHLFIL